MSKNNAFRIIHNGKKAERRDYSKVSGSLELPNLLDVQLKSFKWFMDEGVQEVFEDVFPITSYDGFSTLYFESFEFKEPKYTAEECRAKELTYSAAIYVNLRLDVQNKETGIISSKTENVFMGDFPILTPTATFIINGAERVIVSQIVRSPGAYFKIELEEKTGKELYSTELIPARGTWLEFFANAKKNASVKTIEMSVDRKRKINSMILFKAIGCALDLVNGEDAFSTSEFEKFLIANNMPFDKDVIGDATDEHEFLNIYKLLYTAIFGNYEELLSTLEADKIYQNEDALKAIYENQRSDEIATVLGGTNLIDQKFFDAKRNDINKAGRYKIYKKLGAYMRTKDNYLAADLKDIDGKVVVEKNTKIDKFLLKEVKKVLDKGQGMIALPQKYRFVHPDAVTIPTDWYIERRILASSVETKNNYFEKGTVLTAADVKAIVKAGIKEVEVFDGIIANEIKLTAENVYASLNYGSRLYTLGRLVDEKGADIELDDELVIERFIPDEEQATITNDAKQWVVENVKAGKELTLYLVGAANQLLWVKSEINQEPVKVLGVDPFAHKRTILISDMYAEYSYLLTLTDGVGVTDDIDQLGNRRIRTVGELVQNQYRIGLSRVEKNARDRMSTSANDEEKMTPRHLTNSRSLTQAVNGFFSSSQLSQFMDQQNPLAELTNKRRISALGPGGLTRERAGFEVRDVHSTHYGRICPVETPEGPNIGLINYLTSYAKVNEYGFIETPYRIVLDDYKVSEEVIYLPADEEMDYVIAQAREVKDGYLTEGQCVCRYQTETVTRPREDVELVDVSPKQIISIAAACIPFLENDDASRALMGSNMQRQAVPLLQPHSPYVGTGMEYRVAKDSGAGVTAEQGGIVNYVDATKITVAQDDGNEKTYNLTKFRRSNAATCINQHPIVAKGERVDAGDVIADGQSMQNGELALGQNVRIAFMTWNGYNYEDAVIMSERLVKDDVYTSIHIEEYSIDCRDTKLGPEELTRDIPNVSQDSLKNLDSRGIIRIGAEVKEGDILVGKVTPKGQTEISPEEKLLMAIFGEKSKDVRDNSLRVPHGGDGIVQDVKIFTKKDGAELAAGITMSVKVYIVQKRKIHEGDKMAGRHGNKGVISRILPVEDMPYLADGTPIDIMLNPFGVPSRMNIGQVLEIHLGLAAEKLGCKFATSVFDGINNEELMDILKEANSSTDGKQVLYDGRTGEPFDERIAVGIMYMIKLAHMVDDKLHARATGPYSLVTQQPLGGKAQNGGQRFGEMEMWALEAYGAANTLSEMATVKSDDINGRTKTYEAIIKGNILPESNVPESFRVLTKELQALALDVKVADASGNPIELSVIEEDKNAGKDAEETYDYDSEGGLTEFEGMPEEAVVGADDDYDQNEW